MTANFAMTADGRIATRNGNAGSIGSAADKRRLLEIRAENDAVMVGARTLIADNMTMGLPAEDLVLKRVKRRRAKFPFRIIVSNSGKLNPNLPVFTKPAGPLIIFSTKRMTTSACQKLARHAEVFLFTSSKVPLGPALEILKNDFGIKRLVCEGGGTLLKALLTANLLDEINVTLCPRVFGGKKSPTLTGLAGDYLPASIPLRLVEMKTVESECFTRWKVCRPAAAR